MGATSWLVLKKATWPVILQSTSPTISYPSSFFFLVGRFPQRKRTEPPGGAYATSLVFYGSLTWRSLACMKHVILTILSVHR